MAKRATAAFAYTPDEREAMKKAARDYGERLARQRKKRDKARAGKAGNPQGAGR